MNVFEPSRRITWIFTGVTIAFSAGIVVIALFRGLGIYLYHYDFALVLISFIWIGYWCSIPAALWIAAGGTSIGKARFAAVIAVVIAFFTSQPLRARAEKWNFESRLDRRMEIVRMALRGDIPTEDRGPCDCFYARLTGSDRSLSSDKIILVSKHTDGLSVTFYVDRAAMFSDDDYSAFIYRSDDGEPRTDEEDTDRFTKVVRMQPHWFYVEHT